MSDSLLREAVCDHLLTPANSVLLVIDYQPKQINAINSMSRSQLISNIILLTKVAKNYKLPIILSTVNVNAGNNDTIPALKAELYGVTPIDRTFINAWEDSAFYDAVKKTGRKKLIMAALWTEGCMTFPTLDALEEGFDVYPVVDAVGGTSLLAHDTALRRVEQAGAQLTTLSQVTYELQRDWSREDTVPGMIGILREAGVFLKLD